MMYHITIEDIFTKEIIKEDTLNELNVESILKLLESCLGSKISKEINLENKAIYIFERYFKYDSMKTVIQVYYDFQMKFINFKIVEKGDL